MHFVVCGHLMMQPPLQELITVVYMYFSDTVSIESLLSLVVWIEALIWGAVLIYETVTRTVELSVCLCLSDAAVDMISIWFADWVENDRKIATGVGDVAWLVAPLTSNRWMPVSREFEPHQRLLLFHCL